MRPSMLIQMLRLQWLQTLAECPGCGAENRAPEKLPILLDDNGKATCGACGYTWTPDIRREISS